MAAMSDYLENELINHIFRSTAFIQPTTIAIALCTVSPVDSDTGDLTGKEVIGAGYVRLEVPRDDTNWAAPSNGTTKNVAAIIWPAAGANWGIISHIAILNNTTIGMGNLLFHGELTTPITINTGQVFEFTLEQLAIQMA